MQTIPLSDSVLSRLQLEFVAMVPAIEKMAQAMFKPFIRMERQEFVAETVGIAWKYCLSLVRRGKRPQDFVLALARFAAKAVLAGRRTAGGFNSRELAQRGQVRANAPRLVSLNSRRTRTSPLWKDVLVESRAFPPADVAATRLDFAVWRKTLSERQRQIVDQLIVGEQAQMIARQSGVSAARISQIRRELSASWQAFQGEAQPEPVRLAVA
jgi:hypothetical protein